MFRNFFKSEAGLAFGFGCLKSRVGKDRYIGSAKSIGSISRSIVGTYELEMFYGIDYASKK